MRQDGRHLFKRGLYIGHNTFVVPFCALHSGLHICGECCGMNFHSIPCVEQNSDTTNFVFCWRRNLKRFLISRSAPTKLEPLSFQMSVGFPRRAMKRRNAARKASVVRSKTTSRWTALTVRETNTQYDLVVGHIPYNLASRLFQSLRRDVNKAFSEVTERK